MQGRLLVFISLAILVLAACNVEPETQEIYLPAIEPNSIEPNAVYHPFALALHDFFSDAIPAPYFVSSCDFFMPHSSHAIMVDIDGNGALGVVASKWAEGHNQHSRFRQYLMWICGGELRQESLIFESFGVSDTGRLVVVDEVGACNVSKDSYKFLGFLDEELVFTEGISIWTNWALGWMLEDYCDPDYMHIFGHSYAVIIFSRGTPWEMSGREFEYLTIEYDEFDEIMSYRSLQYGVRKVWELPDESLEILALTIMS